MVFDPSDFNRKFTKHNSGNPLTLEINSNNLESVSNCPTYLRYPIDLVTIGVA